MNDGEIISLQSHTLGSIGQALKHKDDSKLTGEEREVKRIYNGYINQLNKLLDR